MRAHVIESGKVINTIEVESIAAAKVLFPTSMIVDAAFGGQIGDVYDKEAHAFSAPPLLATVVPGSVSRFQALAAMELDGKLDEVEALMSDPDTPKLAKLAYRNALVFERASPTVATMAALLGWTDEYVDQLFITANKIKG